MRTGIVPPRPATAPAAGWAVALAAVVAAGSAASALDRASDGAATAWSTMAAPELVAVAVIVARRLSGSWCALAAAAIGSALFAIAGAEPVATAAAGGLAATLHLAAMDARRRRRMDERPSLATPTPALGLLVCAWASTPQPAAIAPWLACVVTGLVVTLLARLQLPRPGRPPVSDWTIANTLCGYGSFALSCLLLPLAAPLIVILPGRRARWIAGALRRAMRGVFVSTPTVRWRLDGEVAALADARVVLSNHEGMLDILAACALPGTRTLLAKTWVFRAFPLGLAARAAGLRNSDELDADDYRGGATATLGDDVGIFVFPEGTRSRDGRIARFRPGAFVLARSLGAPVVPIAVAGSRQGIRPGSLWIRPSLVASRVLPPLAALPEETNRAYAERCRALVEAERARLARELIASRGWRRNRRERFVGLAPAARRAAAAEERAAVWAALAAVPVSDHGDWLLLGLGAGALPLALRQVAPAARLLAVEDDAARRAVAFHAWWAEGDIVAERLALEALPARLAGVVALVPPAPAEAAAIAQRQPAVVLATDPAPWRPLLPTHRLVEPVGGLAALVAADAP